MVNNGPNTNANIFQIIVEASPELDGKNVVFGKVIDESSLKILKQIASMPVN